MKNPRRTAFDILYKIETDNAYSNLILNSQIKEENYNKLDSAFITALVYGVLERQITLDYILRQYSKLPIRKIENKTLIILRLGILQLLFMDKVPESAAVNESVILAKNLKLQKSSGFINGVLRSITRAQVKYNLPPQSNKVAYYAIKYSCPKEVVELWLNSYGEEITLGILEKLTGRPPLTVRVNTLKTDCDSLILQLNQEDIKAEKIVFLDNALSIKNTGSIENLEAFKQGKIYIQDAASQLCVSILNPQPNDTVIDVCAAPGGKSFTSAQHMNNKGKIFSFDIYKHKLDLINHTSQRLGISIINTELRNAENDKMFVQKGNRVLCDVPCSGLGILRRKPEIRYKKDTNLDFFPQLQYRILCNTVDCIATGGILIYSTCTLNPKENGEIANRFLKDYANDFEPIKIKLPKGITRLINEPENQLTLFLQTANTDGFFISAFKKIR